MAGDEALETTREDAVPEGSTVRRGEMVGRYVVLGPLGSGGMGEVFVAFDPELGRKIALKLLSVDADASLGSGGGQRRLLREANALAQLSHPNVVAVHDVGTHGGRVFMAMELVEGSTLREWIERRKPSWRESLRMLCAAGEGLAAAHRAGFVHRDFKPDNVMVGHDGRVRVMDFGLARPQGAVPPLEPVTLEELGVRSTEIANRSDASGEATRTGALMGTPGYMAPEQHLGAPTTPQTDQFGFSIALHEALYGERPFPGKTLVELGMNVTAGRMRPVPRDSKVPPWLRKIVLRGLAPDPKARWPSMEALLAELAKDPAVARRRWAAVAIGLALVAGAIGVGTQVRARRGLVCNGAQARLTGVWDAAARQKVADAFARTGAPYAGESAARTTRLLDDYATRWVASSTDACEATSVRGEQSQELMDLRNACLAERLQHLRALSAVMAEADASVVEKSVQAAGALPPVDRCDDPAYVRARLKPPDRPEVALEVDRLRDRLARVRALRDAGRYAEGLGAIEEIVAAADRAGFDPLRAEALFAQGSLDLEAGKFPEAEAKLEEAFFVAQGVGHEEVARDAATRLVYVVGYRQERFADGARWARHAQAALRRSGADPEAEAHLHAAMASMREREGRYEDALDHDKQALAIYERRLGKDAPQVAHAQNNLGIVYDHLGRWDESIEAYRRALSGWESALGAGHPTVGVALNNMGLVLLHAGRFDEALSYLRRALALWEKTLGPDHANTSATLTNLADTLVEEGDYAAAAEHARRAIAIRERALGAGHPRLSEPLTSLGNALLGLHDAAGAVPPLERALAMREARVGDPLELADTRFALARALEASGGDMARARALAGKSRETYAAAGPRAARALERVDAWLRAKHGP